MVIYFHIITTTIILLCIRIYICYTYICVYAHTHTHHWNSGYIRNPLQMHIFIKSQSSACMKAWLHISPILLTTAYVLILLCYLFHNIYLPSLTLSGIDLKFKTLVYIFEDCTVAHLQSSHITQGNERSNTQRKNTLYRKASGSKTLWN